MELTIEQAFQQAVEAHKAGRLQDAERLYRAILQAQPKHPDANHNFGVLAVSVNKPEIALPLFKTALEVKPNQGQFWLSYIDVLIKEKQFDNAKDIISQGKKAGLAEESVHAYELQIAQFDIDLLGCVPNTNILSIPIELREEGKYQEAQEWLNNFLNIEQSNAEGWSLLSQVYLLDKRDMDAEKALAKAIFIDPNLPSVNRNQARLLIKKSKPTEALETANIAYDKSSADPESWLVLAACLGANQKDEEALPLLEKALKAKPNYAEAFANRALVHLRAKNITSGIEDLEKAVSLKPHLVQLWGLLGSLRYQSKNLLGAIEALKKANALEPTNVNYMVDLGEFLRQDNQVVEAISVLEGAAKLEPENANVWTNLGTALQHDGKIDDAKLAYQKALVINPKSAEIANNLGAIAKGKGDWESALQYFEQVIIIKPDLAEAHSNLGATLKELGRLEDAVASYKKAIAIKPEFAEAHNNLGITLKELGRLEDAEASYKKAIAIKPEFADAHYNLGNTLKELGRLEDAETSYSKSIAIKPDLAKAHSNLGNTLQELGRLDDAEASYKKAIAIKPDLAEAHSNFGLLLMQKGDLEGSQNMHEKAIKLDSKKWEIYFNYSTYLYEIGHIDSAIDALRNAKSIAPKNNIKHPEMCLKAISADKGSNKAKVNENYQFSKNLKFGLKSDPLILSRPVEKELIAHLYQMNSRILDKTIDSRYGNGKCSIGFDLFNDKSQIIKVIAQDLTRICRDAVASEVYIYDSFFNIYSAGAGSKIHNHITRNDKYFDLSKRKYSLVYYLNVGDQSGLEPGVLKLFNPDQGIMPLNGMIVIINANKYHQALYDGKTDRIMVGVNFYALTCPLEAYH
jgi:tetratricopeptide (TPR) repeat protein